MFGSAELMPGGEEVRTLGPHEYRCLATGMEREVRVKTCPVLYKVIGK